MVAQWALGCWEHYLAGDGEQWLAAARWAADRLLEQQHSSGPYAGGWTHEYGFRHTYRIDPPWMSGMAQGQAASLLIRIHRETDEERYAHAALAALAPMRVPVSAGGVGGSLGGGWFPEEYPTDPPSHVLNGAMFGAWGAYDVAVALGDRDADTLAHEGFETLAASLRPLRHRIVVALRPVPASGLEHRQPDVPPAPHQPAPGDGGDQPGPPIPGDR